MLWYFLGGFALCYAISCIIFGLYDSERFDWLGERFAWFFYLWAIPFAPVLLLYGFVIKPFWMFFRHVLWPPQWKSKRTASRGLNHSTIVLPSTTTAKKSKSVTPIA